MTSESCLWYCHERALKTDTEEILLTQKIQIFLTFKLLTVIWGHTWRKHQHILKIDIYVSCKFKFKF